MRTRVEQCNSATLVRLAHCSACLTTPEVLELLAAVEKEPGDIGLSKASWQEAVTRHNAVKPQDLSILASALSSAKLFGARGFVREEAVRQMQERFLVAFEGVEGLMSTVETLLKATKTLRKTYVRLSPLERR